VVAERLNITPSRLLKLAPTVMLGVGELKPNERPYADTAWLQAAARRMPTATARAPEFQKLKKARPVGLHWSLDILSAMRHIDARGSAGMILAESVSKLPFVIFVANKTQARFVEAMVAFHAFACHDLRDIGPFVISGDSDLWWSTPSGTSPVVLDAYFGSMSKPTQIHGSPSGTQALNPMESLMCELWYGSV
jgi:hypothetical protein